MSTPPSLSHTHAGFRNLLRNGLIPVLGLCAAGGGQAASGTWNSNGTSPLLWSGSTNWLGNVVADGAGFTADFSKVNISAAKNIVIDGAVASRTVGQFLIGDSASSFFGYTISGSNGGTLTFDNGGSGATLTQMASSAANNFTVPIVLADDLLITNNHASSSLTISGGITSTGSRNLVLSADSGGAITLQTATVNHAGTVTNSGTGTGVTTISAAIGSNVTGVVQDSATSVLVLSGSNSAFAGGVKINKGAVTVSSTNGLGTSAVTLGDASGTNNATLQSASTATIAGAINVAGGSTGVLSIASSGAGSSVFSGPVTLANNLTLASNSSGSVNLSGGISGTGNITLFSGSSGGVTISANPANHVGTITNSGAGTGTATISGGVGPNVTGITQASNTSALTISTNAINLGADMDLVSSGSALFTVSGGIVGAHDVAVKANNAGNFTISTGTVNNAGSVTNSGTGTGVTTISAAIGTNVTGVVQESSTSQLTLSGSNTFTTGVNIKQGVVLTGNNAALGTGTLTLGDTSGSQNATLLVGSQTLANAVVVVAGSTNNTLTIASSGNVAARINGPIELNNDLTLRVDGVKYGSNSGALLQTGASATISGTGNLNLVVGGSLSQSNATGHPPMDSLTISGSVATTGAITNSGTGTGRVGISGRISNASSVNQNSETSVLLLTGTNTYSGDTNVNAGVLRIGSSNPHAAFSANTTVNVASGGSLELLNLTAANLINLSGFGNFYSYGAIANVGTTTLSGSIVLQEDAAIASNFSNAILTVSGSVTGSGKTLTTSGVGETRISGPIATGAGGLTKEGTGLLTLSGANSFTGSTTLGNGTVLLNSAGALGGGGNITFTGGSIRHSASNESNLGSRIVNSTSAISVDTNSRNVTYSNIGASNTAGLVKLGSGRLTLDGTNAFTGLIAVKAGVLAVSATSALPSVGTGSILVESQGALNSGGAYANVQAWLDSDNIHTASTGAVALVGNSSEDIDFTGYNGLGLGASTNSTYTGVITAANNTYRLGGGGAVLTLSNNNALTGANGLVVSSGSVTLTGANNLSGPTSVESNTLTLSGAGAVANSDVTVSSGATLALGTSANATAVTRAASVTLNGGTLTGTSNSGTNSVHGITGDLVIGAGGSSLVTLTPNASRNVLLTADDLVRDAGGSGLIRGTGLGLNTIASATPGSSNIQLASGTASLVGSGTSPTTLGIFVGVVGDTSATGTGYAATGGLLTYEANNGVRLLTDSEYAGFTDGSSVLENVRLVSSATGVMTTGTVNANTTINSLSLVASGGTNSGVTVDGTGIITLNSGVIYASTYNTSSGGMTVNNSIDFGSREGVILSNVANTINGLNLNGVLSGSNGITVGGIAGSASRVTLGGAASNTYSGTMTVNGSTLTLAKTGSATSVTGDLLVTSSGRVLISQAEQIANSSTVTVNGGFFQTDANETVSSFLMNGGTATMNAASFTVDNDLSIANGAGMTTSAAGNGAPKAITVGGDLNLSEGGFLRVGRSFSVVGAYDNIVSVGGLNITNAVSGAYTAVTIDNGTSIVQAGGKLVLNGDVTFTGNATNSNTVLIDAINGSGRQGVVSLNGTRAFDIGNGAAKVDLRITGAIVDETAGSGLTKDGAGTLELTGANTYTGVTTVNAGTLLLNGSSVSAVTVAGGVFGGGGATSGAVTVNAGGVLAPGSSIESLETGAVALNAGSTFAVEVDSTVPSGVGADLLKVAGGLDLTGAVTMTLTDIGASPVAFTLGTTFSLINYTGLWNGGLFTVNGNVIADGGSFTLGLNTWQLDYNATSGGSNFSGEYTSGNFVNVTAVPEASSMALVAVSLTTVVLFRRRRR